MPAIIITVNPNESWTYFLNAKDLDQVQLGRLGSRLSQAGWRAHGPVATLLRGSPWRLIVRQPWRVDGEPLEQLELVVRREASSMGLPVSVTVRPREEGGGEGERERPSVFLNGAEAKGVTETAATDPGNGGASDTDAVDRGGAATLTVDKEGRAKEGEAAAEGAHGEDGDQAADPAPDIDEGGEPADAVPDDGAVASADGEPDMPLADDVPEDPAADFTDMGWFQAALAELDTVRDLLKSPGTPAGDGDAGEAAAEQVRENEYRLREINQQLKMLKEVQKAVLGMLLMDKPGPHDNNEAFGLLKEVSLKLIGKDRINEVVVFLARMSLDEDEPEGALEFLNFVQDKGTTEIDALRGRAYSAMDNATQAKLWLNRALKMGYRGRETILAYADLASDDPQTAVYLGDYLEQNPADSRVASYAVMMNADRPEELVAAAEKHLSTLETSEDIVGSLDIFRDRAGACLRLNSDGAADAVADAVEAFILADKDEEALTYAESVWDKHKSWLDDSFTMGHFTDLLSLLETSSDSSVRGRVARWYSNLAQEIIRKMPDSDLALLRSLATRLFILDKEKYRPVREYFEQRRDEVLRQPDDLVAPVPMELEEPKFPKLSQHRILLVGGFPKMIKRLRATLRRHFNAQSVSHIPPKWERNFSQRDVRGRVQNASMVVVITGCLAHATEALVKAACGDSADDDRFIYPRGRGQTSILDAIIGHVKGSPAAGSG